MKRLSFVLAALTLAGCQTTGSTQTVAQSTPTQSYSSELLNLEMPTDVTLVKNWSVVKKMRTTRLEYNGYGQETRAAEVRRNIRNGGGQDHFPVLWNLNGGKSQTTEYCTNRIAAFDIENIPGGGALTPYGNKIDGTQLYRKCVQWLRANYVKQGTKTYAPYEKIVLSWATAKRDPLTYSLVNTHGVTARGFQYATDLADMSMWYAVAYNDVNFTDEQRATVDAYLTKKWLKFNFMTNPEARQKCPINNPSSLRFNGNTGGHNMNNCGDVRINGANGQLALAAVLENQRLWRKALADVDFHLSMIDKEGYFVPHASRGCLARGYSATLPAQWSLTYEILNVTNQYNFWEYQTRHGAKMKDVLVNTVNFIDGKVDLSHYTTKVLGSNVCRNGPSKYIKTGWNPSMEPDMKKVAEAWLRQTKGYVEHYGTTSAKFAKSTTQKYRGGTPGYTDGWMPFTALELNYGN